MILVKMFEYFTLHLSIIQTLCTTFEQDLHLYMMLRISSQKMKSSKSSYNIVIDVNCQIFSYLSHMMNENMNYQSLIILYKKILHSSLYISLSSYLYLSFSFFLSLSWYITFLVIQTLYIERKYEYSYIF